MTRTSKLVEDHASSTRVLLVAALSRAMALRNHYWSKLKKVYLEKLRVKQNGAIIRADV